MKNLMKKKTNYSCKAFIHRPPPPNNSCFIFLIRFLFQHSFVKWIEIILLSLCYLQWSINLLIQRLPACFGLRDLWGPWVRIWLMEVSFHEVVSNCTYDSWAKKSTTLRQGLMNCKNNFSRFLPSACLMVTVRQRNAPVPSWKIKQIMKSIATVP